MSLGLVVSSERNHTQGVFILDRADAWPTMTRANTASIDGTCGDRPYVKRRPSVPDLDISEVRSGCDSHHRLPPL
jgi:hypothetical protein